MKGNIKAIVGKSISGVVITDNLRTPQLRDQVAVDFLLLTIQNHLIDSWYDKHMKRKA